jgi:hypothetical protein
MNDDLIRTVRDADLRKMFEEAKSRDLTESQFEANKTQRICALVEALKSIPVESDYVVSTSVTNSDNGRSEILRMLRETFESKYEDPSAGLR